VATPDDGLILARWLSEHFQVGIIILTGLYRETGDHILGLEMGADAYMTKPFHLDQLRAQVKSVLRRTATRPAEGQAAHRSRSRFAGWELDLTSRELFSPSGAAVPPTTGEFDLLAAFVNNPNEVLGRDRLLDLARHREAQPCDRAIDVQIARLRRRIGDDAEKPAMIKTVRGSGYMFTPTVEWISHEGSAKAA
jgi:two-component system OmpR family response regulator